MEVVEHHSFRVTRNEDLEVEEDDAENLLQALEKELLRRRFGPPVRLEVATDINPAVRRLLVRELGVEEEEVFTLPAPLDLRGLNVISGIDRADLHYPQHLAHTSRFLNESETSKAANVFAAMRRRDILLHHPYDSFSTSVQAFLEQAAADPKVQAIKQTLYRTSGDSPIVDALIDAAEAGKQVLALVEIKARFDEQANIAWARKLEQAGVHVVYGIVGLKTHSKLSLVVRREGDRLRRYCHIGTGNYHPRTARYYEDLGLLTCDDQVGEDLSRLFNQLSGYAPRVHVQAAARGAAFAAFGPDRPHRAGDRQPQGRPGRARGHQGQLHGGRGHHRRPLPRLAGRGAGGRDRARHLRAAPGRAGAEREHPRALDPGPVPGALPRVRLRQRRASPIVYIGSADMMHRNLDRRVEALVRSPTAKTSPNWCRCWTATLIRGTASWHLDSDGRLDPPPQGRGRQRPLTDIQCWLLDSRSRQRWGGPALMAACAFLRRTGVRRRQFLRDCGRGRCPGG